MQVSHEKIPYQIIDKDASVVQKAYKNANNRILFLDYDGTLVGFSPTPERAKPGPEVKQLLAMLAKDEKNTVVLISGRDRWTMEEWFGDLNVHLIASHGLWTKNCTQCDWTMTITLNNDWIESVRHVLEVFSDRIPGSFIEEKEYSLAWHYRQSDPELVASKINSLKETLSGSDRLDEPGASKRQKGSGNQGQPGKQRVCRVRFPKQPGVRFSASRGRRRDRRIAV